MYILVLVLVGVSYLLLQFFVFLPRHMKRAMYKIVQLLRENNATSSKKAVVADELGIKSLNLITLSQHLRQGFMGSRDRGYKDEALRALVRSGVVRVTEDKKYYLSEEGFLNSKLYRPDTYPH